MAPFRMRGEELEKTTWPNKLEYHLALFNQALGLCSFWRFPYLAFENKGAPFVYVFLILYLLIGVPMVFLEMLWGQYSNLAPTQAYGIVPIIQGCDTVSSFAGRGKKMAWKAFSIAPGTELSSSFNRLTNIELDTLDDASSDDIGRVERYLMSLYIPKSVDVGSFQSLNECRRFLFTKSGCCKSSENLPPTRDAFLQHLKRAIYQARIWCQSLKKNQCLPIMTTWGWKPENGVTCPLWLTIPELSKACNNLMKCSCKGKCSNHCKCKRNSLKCTELCACKGNC